MATENTATVISIQESELDVGDNGSITVQAGSAATPNTNIASGTTVAGNAKVTADTAAQCRPAQQHGRHRQRRHPERQ